MLNLLPPTEAIVAFVPNETLALCFAVHLAGRGVPYLLMMSSGATISEATLRLVTELGARVDYGDPDTSPLEGVREIYLHTFEHSFETLLPLIWRCRAEGIEVIGYADGLKGEYASDFLRKAEIGRMLFFGWVFDKGDLAEVRIEATPLSRFVTTFRRFRPAGAPALAQHPRGMVILMRYWGRGNYALKPGVGLAEAMFRSITFNPDLMPETIFVKSDPRVPAGAREAFMRICAERTSAEVRDFTDLVGVEKGADQLPLEMLWFEPTGAACYGFDSSVAIYLAALGERRILFPNEKVVNEVFALSQGINAVVIYSRLFHRVCQAVNKEGTEVPLILHRDPNVAIRKLAVQGAPLGR